MRIQNEFLQAYLKLTEDTESPRVFHVVSALAGIGACLGRRAWFPFGFIQIFPNNYYLLVGPPGVRKNVAINLMQSMVRAQSHVRFAPADTGGARQGLIGAMRGDSVPDEELDGLANLAIDLLEIAKTTQVNLDDKHTMFVVASEFTTFIGINSVEMITFLTKIWDGEDYQYKLKNEYTTLTNPLLSMIGGTTPSALAESMPPSAIGGGFMSRIILVHGARKYKHIKRPLPLDAKLRKFIEDRYGLVSKTLSGPFSETPEAAELLDSYYECKVKISDPRFIYYIERRHTHLIKCVQCLAAARGSMEIARQDVEDASLILESIEPSMEDALGEYGLSQLSAAKQKLLEFIQFANGLPVYLTHINAIMKRDMKPVDLYNSLSDLSNAGKIKLIQADKGEAYVAIDRHKEQQKLVDDILMEELIK